MAPAVVKRQEVKLSRKKKNRNADGYASIYDQHNIWIMNTRLMEAFSIHGLGLLMTICYAHFR